MNTIPAQEIQRRGVAAFDDAMENGDLYIIRNNKPQYVVLSKSRYEELLLAEEDAAVSRVQTSLRVVRRANTKTFNNAMALLAAIEADERD